MIRRHALDLALALPLTAAREQAWPKRIDSHHLRIPALAEPLRLPAVRERPAEAARSNRPAEILARVMGGLAKGLRACARESAGVPRLVVR